MLKVLSILTYLLGTSNSTTDTGKLHELHGGDGRCSVDGGVVVAYLHIFINRD